jgi:hypothetical protein
MPIAVHMLNKRPSSVKGWLSPNESTFRIQQRYDAVEFLHRLVDGVDPLPPRNFRHFEVNEKVLFKHPNRKRAKLDDLWEEYTVIKASTSGLVYHIKADFPGLYDHTVIAHYNQLRVRPSAAPLQQAPSRPCAPQRAAVPVNEPPCFIMNELVLFRDDIEKHFFVAAVKGQDPANGLVELHVYGTSRKGRISQRRYHPGWISDIDGRYLFQSQKPKFHQADIRIVPASTVLERRLHLANDHRLPTSLINQYGSVHNYTLCAESSDPFANVFIIDNGPGAALISATTHQEVDYQSLSKEEVDEMQQARYDELQKFKDMEVYKLVSINDLPSGARPIATRWVDTKKLKNGVRVFKSRLVCRGDYLKGRREEEPPTSTGNCTQSTMRFAYLAALKSPHWTPEQIKVVDVITSFLQAPIRSKAKLYLHFPVGHPYYRIYVMELKRCVYGLPESGHDFELFLSEKLKLLNYKRVIMGLWTRCNARGVIEFIVLTYADDLNIIGLTARPASVAAEEIRQLLDCHDAEPLTRCIGVNYEVAQDYIRASQENYALSLNVPADKVAPSQPLPSNMFEYEDNSPVLADPNDIKNYRSDLGSLAWLAGATRCDLSYSVGTLARYNNEPTERARRLLTGAMAYAKKTAKAGLLLQPTDHDKLELDVYCDASFGSPINPYPTTGYVFLVKGAPILWASRRQRRVSRSTTSAEINSLAEAVDEVNAIVPVLSIFWKSVNVKIKCDSADTISLIRSVHPKPSEKALIHKIMELKGRLYVIPAMALIDAIGDYSLEHVISELNLSDSLTKARDVSALFRLLQF